MRSVNYCGKKEEWKIYMVLRAGCDSVTETAVHFEVRRLELFENIDHSN